MVSRDLGCGWVGFQFCHCMREVNVYRRVNTYSSIKEDIFLSESLSFKTLDHHKTFPVQSSFLSST